MTVASEEIPQGQPPQTVDYFLREDSPARSEADTVPPTQADPAAVARTGTGQDGQAALPQVPGYEIQRPLGRGGMGVVYLARQVQLDRLVALKMILAGSHAGEQERLRFLAEAAVLAKLQHPHIVQVHDFGTLDGNPFFALEYVAGGSLDDFLDGTPQPTQDAARFLIVLAQAMHAAHGKGIIHRDLKPANILLSLSRAPEARVEASSAPASGARLNESIPKITDFGLAKQLDLGTGMTATGVIMGTPSYMAPEQAAAQKELGPAADIYALGAILYEMLTGRPPFKAATPIDTIFQVLQEEPVPPRQFQPAVPRDLETICLKCLHKEPARRYGTAQALADDLQRLLDGQSVLARPVGTAERLGKWARRKPALASLVGVLLLVPVALGVAVARENGLRAEAEHNEQRAKTNEEKALSHLHLARDALNDLFRTMAEDPTLKDERLRDARLVLLRKAKPLFERLQVHGGASEDILRDAADTYLHWAVLTQEMDDKEDAKQAFQQALAIYQRLIAHSPHNPDYQSSVAILWYNLGVLHCDTGNTQEAIQCCRQALSLQQLLAAASPDAPGLRAELARTWHLLGVAQKSHGQYADAWQSWQQALQLQQNLVEGQKEVAGAHANLANTWHSMGVLHNLQGRVPQAMECWHKALALQQQLVAARPGVSLDRAALALTWDSLGTAQNATRQHAAARHSLQEALQHYQALTAAHPSVTLYRAALATTWHNLGVAQRDLGQPQKALSSFQQAMALQQQLVDAQPSVTRYRVSLGYTLFNLGNLQANRGQFAEARRCFADAVQHREKVAAAFPGVDQHQAELGSAWNNLGAIQAQLGQMTEALTSWQHALRLTEQLAQAQPGQAAYQRDLANTVKNLSMLYRRTGRPQEAVRLLEERAATHPDRAAYHVELAAALQALAGWHSDKGRWQEARASYERALQVLRPWAERPTADISWRVTLGGLTCNLGHLTLKDGSPVTEALPWYAQAIATLTAVRQQAPHHEDARLFLRNAHWGRATALDTLQRYAESLPDWDQAVALDQRGNAAYAISRAVALARAGRFEQARVAALELKPAQNWPGPEITEIARALALCHRGLRESDPAREARAERALELLRQAQRRGHFQAANHREALAREEDWSSLRPRADYQQWWKEISGT